MNKENEEIKKELEMLKGTKRRDAMPRPTVFKDKSKYDRNKVKQLTRKEKDNY